MCESYIMFLRAGRRSGAMAFTDVVLALLLEVGIVAVSVAGLVRVAGLRAFADDARLRRLSWFFGLFGSAVAIQVLVSTFLLGGHPMGHEAMLPTLATLVLIQHVLMLSALVVALRTFAVPWQPAAVAPALLAFGQYDYFVFLALVEAILTLYLAIASAVNQRRRKTGRSMRVAAGFLLLFLGHLFFFVLLLLHHDSGPRPYWGDALALVGIALIVVSVPRKIGVSVPSSRGS